MTPTPRTENINQSEDMTDVMNGHGEEESFEVQESDASKVLNLNSGSDVDSPKLNEDDSYEYAERRSCCCFAVEHVSNFFFLLASSLYVALAFQHLHYEQKVDTYHQKNSLIPQKVLYAEDDYSWGLWLNETGYYYDDVYTNTWTDDTFASFGNVDTSYYQALYFSAATCYVINGLLSLVLEPGLLAVVLIVAGSFGVASACLIESNLRLAIIFNSVSVHLFLLDAIGMFCTRSSVASKALKWFIRFGGLCWIIGTSMDVAFSYVYLSTESPPLGVVFAAIGAAFLWLTSAIVTTITTCCMQFQPALSNANRAYHLDKEAKSFDEEESPENPLSTKDSMAL